MSAIQQLAPHVGQAAACRALALPRASWYRRLQPVALRAGRRPPARALLPAERQTVLQYLHAERFRDQAPAEVFATLLDEGVYLCSLRSMYRILAESGEIGNAGTNFVILSIRSLSYSPPLPIKSGAGI